MSAVSYDPGCPMSHPKILICGCERLFEYNCPSSEYIGNFSDFSGNYSRFLSLELNSFNEKF